MRMEVEHAIPGYLVDGYCCYLDDDMDESHYIEQHLKIRNVVAGEEEGNSDDGNEEGEFQLEKGRITGMD